MDPITSVIQPLVEAAIAPPNDSKKLSVSVGLIQGDHTHTYHSGIAHPPRDNSLYEIGSVTKLFTATLLARLSQGEKPIVALEDPVRQHLPNLPDFPEAITLRRLSTHTSGLPRLPRNIWWSILKNPTNPYVNYSNQDLYKFLSRYHRKASNLKRLGQFEYSNLGVGLLGHVLESATQQSYGQLVQQYITQPLDMMDTGIRLNPDQRRRLIPGYLPNNKPATNWDLPAIAGAGALRSSLEDMLTFMAANLQTPDQGQDDSDAGAIHDPTTHDPTTHDSIVSAMARCHVPQQTITPQQKVDRDIAPQDSKAQSSIGLGWFIRPVPESTQPIYWHNGATGGYQSYVAFHKAEHPAQRLAVVVLANRALNGPGKGFSGDGLGLKILRTLLTHAGDSAAPNSPGNSSGNNTGPSDEN